MYSVYVDLDDDRSAYFICDDYDVAMNLVRAIEKTTNWIQIDITDSDNKNHYLKTIWEVQNGNN